MDAVLEELAAALRSVVDAVSKGDDVNAGVVKAAKLHNLNLEKTRRIVEGINTLNFLKMFKSAADKTQEFPLADLKRIWEEIQGTVPEKTASVNMMEYLVDEQDYLHPPMLKIGAVAVPERTYPKSLEDVTHSVLSHPREFRKKAQVAAVDAESAKTSLIKAIVKLAEYFSKTSSQPFEEFEKEAYAVHDPAEIIFLLDTIAKHASLAKKRAPKEPVDTVVDTCTQPHQLLKLAKESAREYVDKTRKTRESKDKELVANEKITELFKKKAAPLSPLSINLAQSFIESLAKGRATEPQARRQERFKFGLTHPRTDLLTAEIEDLQRQGILQDLMENDEQLSLRSPEEVVGAYQAMLDFAPSAAKHKELARGWLREATATPALGTQSVSLLLDLENSLRERES